MIQTRSFVRHLTEERRNNAYAACEPLVRRQILHYRLQCTITELKSATTPTSLVESRLENDEDEAYFGCTSDDDVKQRVSLNIERGLVYWFPGLIHDDIAVKAARQIMTMAHDKS